MVKIKDIAERCGLSIASVSKALHGESDLNQKTAEYIRSVAKEMGYVPNASARLLKTKRSYNIGVLFVDETSSGLEHEYFSSILNSIKDEAEKNGYDITFISHHFGSDYLTFYEHAKYRNVDGVIIASVDFRDPEVIRLVESEIPTVTIDYEFNNVASVISDNVQGVRDIVNYLVNMGHEKIAFITGEDTSVTQKRIASFYKTCEERNISVKDEYVKKGRYHIPKVSGEATRELLTLEDKPTVIMYPDDYSLLGGITEIEKHGLRIPDDISIVGYDGIKLSRLIRPIITTYVQNSAEIGVRATKKLVDLIENPKTTIPDRTLVIGGLQEGSTVKKIV
ncbi:MAG: LacI family DNA-binding transcriptional regulator [Acholeplasmatales bacterium]|nr:LacI family DNA-binding transcriptional regulator [Acholeplasmatales bacterium]